MPRASGVETFAGPMTPRGFHALFAHRLARQDAVPDHARPSGSGETPGTREAAGAPIGDDGRTCQNFGTPQQARKGHPHYELAP